MDLLVSMAVMSILMGILTPTLGLVAESARRVKCQKKLSDVGLALTMWVGDHRDTLPPSDVANIVYSTESPSGEAFQASTLMQIAHFKSDNPNSFDGLGRLVAEEYLSDPSALYCPSHRGEHPFGAYENSWVTLHSEIVINFNYRLFDGPVQLSRIDPATVLVTDGMRSIPDYNHGNGNNMLRADMSVTWFLDDNDYIESMLPASEHDSGAGIPVATAWAVMDTGDAPDNGSNDPPAEQDGNRILR